MILKIFLFWRLGLLLITYLGSFTFPLVANGALGAIGPGRQFDFWKSQAQWDGGHYFQIANQGYLLNSDFAFFPFFPALIKFFALILNGNYLLSGLLISNIAFVTFLLIFYKFIKDKYSKDIAFFATVTYLVFPTSFFAVSYYSESIFLLLVILTLKFLKDEKFLLSAIFASLASLTRLIGIMLTVSLIYSYFSKINFNLKKLNRYFLHISVASFGFVSYSVYLFYKVNDPLKFLNVQSFWLRQVVDPISTIFTYLPAPLTAEPRAAYDYFDLLLTLLFLTILIVGIRKISSSLWIFSMLVILIPASTGTLTSMPRYLLASLGTFVIIGQYLETKPKLRLTIWAVLLTLQAILAVRFVNGYWVA